MKEKLIRRYSAAERINHWIVAVCFVLLERQRGERR